MRIQLYSGHQVSQKKNLARHKKIEDKYTCRQCGYYQNQRVVHEGVRHPCSQCNHQATIKGNLVRHQRAVHEGVIYSCRLRIKIYLRTNEMQNI